MIIPPKPMFTEPLRTYVDPLTKQIIKDMSELNGISEAAVVRGLLKQALLSDSDLELTH